MMHLLFHIQESIEIKLERFGVMVEEFRSDHSIVTYCDDIPSQDMSVSDRVVL